MSNPIILYDGVCGLCHRLVQFLLKQRTLDRFRFASLQSNFAARVLQRHGSSPGQLDTLYVVLNFEEDAEHLLARSEAAAYVLRELGGRWRSLGGMLRALPAWMRDFLYDLVARSRYRLHGKYAICPLPDAKYRSRFLDVG
jgi:predicted DCC family thiol-disulfide oxidoreductase YuxK